MSEPVIREVSLKPPADPALRRYSRVIAMVSELHKAGYQRIRLFPALSPNGGFLRAEITFADNTSADGLPINDAWVARYSTGDGTAFFGWPDATDMNARQLAAAFVERFPEIARQGQGRDWAYAGWLLEILGQAEAGDPIILWADGDFLSAEHLALWQPPSVISETPALPPLHTHIPNDALTLEIVPESNYGWDRLEPFCTYYDGYDGDRRSISECGDIAKRVFEDVANASMDDLRIALFFQQRKIRWNDHMPVQKEHVDEIRPVIAEIRRRLSTAGATPLRQHPSGPMEFTWDLPSKNDPLSTYQAQVIVSSIQELNDVLPWEFEVDRIEQINLENYKKIFEIAEYLRFMTACYACGFVTHDTSPDFPLEQANARPEEVLGTCDLPALRHYLHSLCRDERWSDGYSSPVLEALVSGSLQLVGRRLSETDGFPGY